MDVVILQINGKIDSCRCMTQQMSEDEDLKLVLGFAGREKEWLHILQIQGNETAQFRGPLSWKKNIIGGILLLKLALSWYRP